MLLKKGGVTMVKNEDNEFLMMRTVTGWRIYVDYQKLNKGTKNDKFPHSSIKCLIVWRARHFIASSTDILEVYDSHFSDMVEDFLEIFMVDFSVSGDDFDRCLDNLFKVLK
ncbi:uncharacterized protein LOC120155410 [Hibiscus syriacus]|uniref:uncharacterized protein LOC120155410 n=1 Tax=Hibiscus syriacus TaxID=106335 RepID=UPI001923AE80|nr:uncharacterized protein LOC120155410 [Hibiscus syriacus]